MSRGVKWFYWLGVVVLAAAALWTSRAESMPPVVLAAVAGVAAMASSTPAQAATTPAAPPATAKTAGQQADKVLSRAMNGIQAAGVRMAGSLWEEGITLFWLVWILMLGWTIYKNYHQSEDLVGALALFGAVSTFILLVMMLYMPPRAGVGTWGGSPVYMAQIFTGGFEDYARKIAGNSGIPEMTGAGWSNLLGVAVKMFQNSVLQLMHYAEGAHLLPDSPKWWDYVPALFREVLRIPHIILGLIAAIFVEVAMVIYIFVVLMADVLVVVGLTLGPIMIPFYLMPVLSFLFDGWLRFMITAGFFKLVATVMLGLTYNLVKELTITSKSLADTSNQLTAGVWVGDLMSLLLAVVISILTLLLMWQVPSIAAALTQGNAGGDMTKAARTLDNAAKLLMKGKS
ncbi:MAG: type IV secretion system protein [Gammaproteobacteria bacterium]|nr:type IV secretion system protein [Gammaproteobacteria bacterium]